MNATKILQIIRRNGDSLFVNVAGQGLAFAEFLDDQRVKPGRIIIKKTSHGAKDKTVVELLRE